MPSSPKANAFHIGCAGWSIPHELRGQFPVTGTHLQRYGATFSAVEINSSFYRPHRTSTYARWAESVPEHFRFCVKMPMQITHQQRLADTVEQISKFVNEATALGDRLGCLLVHLPPSLKLNVEIAGEFFRELRACYAGPVVCEPRHASWFSPSAAAFLEQHNIGRVAADPAPHSEAAQPAGNSVVTYFRLHGSPTMYYSAYTSEFLATLAATLTAYRRQGDDVWCIFDNTAEGFATANALELQALLTQRA